MKLIYLKSALECNSFDVPFFKVLVTIEPGCSLLQFVTTNCLMAWLIIEMREADILGNIELGIGGGSVGKGESTKENRRDMLSLSDLKWPWTKDLVTRCRYWKRLSWARLREGTEKAGFFDSALGPLASTSLACWFCESSMCRKKLTVKLSIFYILKDIWSWRWWSRGRYIYELVEYGLCWSCQSLGNVRTGYECLASGKILKKINLWKSL